MHRVLRTTMVVRGVALVGRVLQGILDDRFGVHTFTLRNCVKNFMKFLNDVIEHLLQTKIGRFDVSPPYRTLEVPFVFTCSRFAGCPPGGESLVYN